MEVKSIFRNVGGYEWPHVEWYDQRYIRQRKPSKICLTVLWHSWKAEFSRWRSKRQPELSCTESNRNPAVETREDKTKKAKFCSIGLYDAVRPFHVL